MVAWHGAKLPGHSASQEQPEAGITDAGEDALVFTEKPMQLLVPRSLLASPGAAAFALSIGLPFLLFFV